MSQTELIQNNPEDEWIVKLCLVGSSKLKTALARSIAENIFSSDYLPTLGVDITIKRLTVNEHRVRLVIMDTAVQPQFGRLRHVYYEGASACVIFFEKHDDDSFSAVPDWITDVQKFSGDLPLILVGIITYDPEQVSYASARKYALYWGMEFYAINVTDGPYFETILKDLVQFCLQKISSS